MTGTRRDCPLTCSLTDNKQVKNQHSSFNFHQNFSCRLWGPDTARNPSWVWLRAAPNGRTALNRPNCGSSADFLPARWTCWDCGSLRWPSPAPRPCWSGAASLFPSTPSAGVSSGTAGHFRVRLCACAPSFRVSAGKWRQKQRFLQTAGEATRQWEPEAAQDGDRKPPSGINTPEMSFNSKSPCFLHQYESIQTSQLNIIKL